MPGHVCRSRSLRGEKQARGHKRCDAVTNQSPVQISPRAWRFDDNVRGKRRVLPPCEVHRTQHFSGPTPNARQEIRRSPLTRPTLSCCADFRRVTAARPAVGVRQVNGSKRHRSSVRLPRTSARIHHALASLARLIRRAIVCAIAVEQ